MTKFLVCGLVAGVLLTRGGTSDGAEAPLGSPSVTGALPAAVAAVYPAVVRVHVVVKMPMGGRVVRRRGSGSGAVISADGYIVTNHHVAGNAEHITCYFTDGTEVPARLIGTDAMADVAVIKVDPKAVGRPLTVAQWGDSDRVRVGEVVYAMGSPGAMSQSVTRGIIANTRMTPPGNGASFVLDGENVGSIVRWLTHDAVIYGGNSGGPLLDSRGEIIGINEIGIANLGGAIPSRLAQRIAAELIDHGAVQRSKFGVTIQHRKRSVTSENCGVLVASVAPASPAAKAGVKAGDLLLSIDGKRLDAAQPEQMPAVNDCLMSLPVGKEVALTLLRRGAMVEVRVTPTARPPRQAPVYEIPEWGAVFRKLNAAAAAAADLGARGGLRINSIRPGGCAATAKPPLRAGDVLVTANGDAVDSPESLDALTSKLMKLGTKDVVVSVRRGRASLMAVCTLGAEKVQPQRPSRLPVAWLGVQCQVVLPAMGKALGIPSSGGMRVTRVLPVYGGEEPPLKLGDVIVRIGDSPVRATQRADRGRLKRVLRKHRVGEMVTLAVIRGGEEMAVRVRLLSEPAGPESVPQEQFPTFGFSARETVLEDRVAAQRHGLIGSVVRKVDGGSWAALGGLLAGDMIIRIDAIETLTVKSLRKAISQLEKSGKSVFSVFVLRKGKTLFLEIEKF